MQLDVAVIGAGCAGAYSAWRLQQDRGARQRIGLFEYSDRVGGRLYTVTLPGLPHVKAEVGGMRYIPSQHAMVAGLVDHLKLPTKPFPMGATDASGKSVPPGSDCNIFYLRGRHLRLHELADPAKVPYNLAWPERGLGPTNLQVQVMNNLCPGFADLSLCQQMQVQVFGKPIWQYGFWDLMYRVLSNEGYQFMKDAGGYDANVANANAVTQLPATEYSDDTEFLTLRDGYDQLPITLVRQFDQDFDGVLPRGQRVFMNHRLAAIHRTGDAEWPYRLRFEPTVTTAGRTAVDRTREPIEVHCRQLILGLPRRALELIEGDYFDDPWLRENIPSVLVQQAFKLFLAYERPWWRALGVEAGRAVTDLPVRQVYYFGTEGAQPGGEPWMNSLLMASYNDIGTVPFWKGLERGPAYAGYRPACIGPGVDHRPAPMPGVATDEMVRVANRQVAEVHGLPEVPLPYAAVYHDWSDDPYGGGWHEWKAGYRLDEIMCRMRKPVAGDEIYIAGEAYSYGQGWVEGALDTAESLLQQYFGLAWPEWLPRTLGGQPVQLLPNPCPGCGDLGGCGQYTGGRDGLEAITMNCLKRVQEG
jgi:monoamine oxidase